MQHQERWTYALWLFSAFLITGCVSPDPGWGDVDLANQAIVGGTETDQWPAIGAYLIDGGNSGICTATLVRPDVLLTAGHCADGAGELDAWYIGPNIWGSPSSQWVPIREAILHPSYEVDGSYYGHDMAVLLLEEPITDYDYIPVNTFDIDHTWTGKSLHFVGYGSDTVYGGPGSGIKRETDIPIIDYYNELIYTYAEGTNTCTGDSGGPALAEVDGQLYVAGVLSWVWSYGESHDSCKYGGNVSMRVDYELEFLSEFFDPYETPYPEEEDDTEDEDLDDDEEELDDDGGCECRSAAGSPFDLPVPLAVMLALASVFVRRRRESIGAGGPREPRAGSG